LKEKTRTRKLPLRTVAYPLRTRCVCVTVALALTIGWGFAQQKLIWEGKKGLNATWATPTHWLLAQV